MQANKDTAKHPGGNGGVGFDLDINRSLIKINNKYVVGNPKTC